MIFLSNLNSSSHLIFSFCMALIVVLNSKKFNVVIQVMFHPHLIQAHPHQKGYYSISFGLLPLKTTHRSINAFVSQSFFT